MTTTTTRTFETFYVNDGSQKEMDGLYTRLLGMTDGMTTTINEWAVTRWNDESFEIGTWGKAEKCVCLETAVEALASSTNKL